MVNQMCVISPGPSTSMTVRVCPGATCRLSALPPVGSVLEMRRSVYSCGRVRSGCCANESALKRRTAAMIRFMIPPDDAKLYQQPRLQFSNRRVLALAREVLDGHERPRGHAIDIHRAIQVIDLV